MLEPGNQCGFPFSGGDHPLLSGLGMIIRSFKEQMSQLGADDLPMTPAPSFSQHFPGQSGEFRCSREGNLKDVTERFPQIREALLEYHTETWQPRFPSGFPWEFVTNFSDWVRYFKGVLAVQNSSNEGINLGIAGSGHSYWILPGFFRRLVA